MNNIGDIIEYLNLETSRGINSLRKIVFAAKLREENKAVNENNVPKLM